MDSVVNIIKELESTSSTNEKISIIAKNSDNEMFRKVLFYTYADNFQYGFSEEKLRSLVSDWDNINMECNLPTEWNNIFDILDELAISNINDELRITVGHFLSKIYEEYRELYIRIITKDLRCGISTKTINKAIPKLIPTWEVQQAYPIEKYKLKKNEWIALSLKLNGIRTTELNGLFRSRQNKPMYGYDHILKDIINTPWLDDFVIDGELIRKNVDGLSDNENFRLTTSIVNSDKPRKEEIQLVVFDLIPKDEFMNGKSSEGFKYRLENYLDKLRDKFGDYNVNNNITVAPTYYRGTDHSQIDILLDKVDSEGLEGLMCLRNAPYQCKRHSGILKCKKFKNADIRILGSYEGSGKLKGTLGGFICNYKGYPLNVGGGYTDEQRKLFWEHKEEYVGKILQIKYKEESTNKQGGLSAQFPVFVCMRPDKNEESYN